MKTSNKIMFEVAVKVIQQFCPTFKAVPKDGMLLHRIISVILKPFNPRYLKDFWTTIGFTAAFPDPDGDDESEAWWTVFHEGVHGIQAMRLTRVVMGFLYLIPLSFAVLGLIALFPLYIWALLPWWGDALVIIPTLVCLLPLPAYFRMKMELEAYTVSLAVWYWWRNEDRVDHYAKHFYGSNYYFMWPFKAWITAALQQQLNFIVSGRILSDPYFRAVFLAMYDHGFVHHAHQDHVNSVHQQMVDETTR